MHHELAGIAHAATSVGNDSTIPEDSPAAEEFLKRYLALKLMAENAEKVAAKFLAEGRL